MSMNALKTRVSMVPFVRILMVHITATVAMDLEANTAQTLFLINTFQHLGTSA